MSDFSEGFQPCQHHALIGLSKPPALPVVMTSGKFRRLKIGNELKIAGRLYRRLPRSSLPTFGFYKTEKERALPVKRNTKQLFSMIFVFAVIAATYSCRMLAKFDIGGVYPSYIRAALYLLLFSLWGFSIDRRIIHKQTQQSAPDGTSDADMAHPAHAQI